MREGTPSVTAQRVAAYRLGLDRLASSFGNPAADDQLAADVAGGISFERDDHMARYLQLRTAFFDRVLVHALDRDVLQVVVLGAGYDGRSLRYARPGVRWFEVDHPDTQRDKQARIARLGLVAADVSFIAFDLTRGGVADVLVSSGFDPDASSVILCEGVAGYLEQPALESLLRDVRSVVTVGTRFALSVSVSGASPDQLARRDRLRAGVGALGEPVLNSLDPDDADRLLRETRWRAAELSERARAAGLIVGIPLWAPVLPHEPAPQTRSRVGVFMERMYDRAGTADLPAHLEATYGIAMTGMRELDVGVFRLDLVDGRSWVARVYPKARPVEAVEVEAGILEFLREQGFPAERCARPDPVSTREGQGVLVTEFVRGGRPPRGAAAFARLGDLLGRLHTVAPGPEAITRAGGAWHHLALAGGPADELAAARTLLDDAGPRVPRSQQELYRTLCAELEQADDGHDLPASWVHPDLVPVNVINDPAGQPVVVDWTGAGRGPRLCGLGFLLWAAGAQSLSAVDAVIEAYRAHVALEPEELDRLAAVVGVRALVFGSWEFSTGRQQLPDVLETLATRKTRAAAIAARAIAALHRSTR